MKLNQTLVSSASIAGVIFLSSSAMAQEVAPAEAPAEQPKAAGSADAEVEAGAETAATTETPVEVSTEEPAVAEETPGEEPAVDAPATDGEDAVEAGAVEEEAVATEEVAETEEAVEAAPAEEADLEPVEKQGGASLFAFADAWMGWQSAKSGRAGGGGVYANAGPGGTAESGFGVNWLGADLGYDGGEWGLTGSLRYGDGVAIYGTGTLGPVTQAYVTWRPVDGLSLDLGTFGTIYGAEVAESWQNLNYTRGELYFNMQPFWHTGLRAEYVAGSLTFRGLVVNEPNSSNLGEGALNAGAQVGYDSDMFSLYLGGLQSLKPDTTARPKVDTDGDGVLDAGGGFIDTFIDVVATASVGDLSVVGNFDLNVGSEDGIAGFWGASLAAGYQFVPAFGMAVRGEYLSTPDGFLGFGSTDDDENLMTGTLTFDVKPAGVDNFVVRWDNRVEVASEEVYVNDDATEAKDTWFSSTIGVAAFADFL